MDLDLTAPTASSAPIGYSADFSASELDGNGILIPGFGYSLFGQSLGFCIIPNIDVKDADFTWSLDLSFCLGSTNYGEITVVPEQTINVDGKCIRLSEYAYILIPIAILLLGGLVFCKYWKNQQRKQAQAMAMTMAMRGASQQQNQQTQIAMVAQQNPIVAPVQQPAAVSVPQAPPLDVFLANEVYAHFLRGVVVAQLERPSLSSQKTLATPTQ